MPKRFYVFSAVLMTPNHTKYANFVWYVVSDQPIDSLKKECADEARAANPGFVLIADPSVIEVPPAHVKIAAVQCDEASKSQPPVQFVPRRLYNVCAAVGRTDDSTTALNISAGWCVSTDDRNTVLEDFTRRVLAQFSGSTVHGTPTCEEVPVEMLKVVVEDHAILKTIRSRPKLTVLHGGKETQE